MDPARLLCLHSTPVARDRCCGAFGNSPMTQRASICVASDAPEEQAAFDAWLDRWESRLTFISDDYGCGCCVHLYDIEGPKEAVDALPEQLRTSTAWREKGVRSHS